MESLHAALAHVCERYDVVRLRCAEAGFVQPHLCSTVTDALPRASSGDLSSGRRSPPAPVNQFQASSVLGAPWRH